MFRSAVAWSGLLAQVVDVVEEPESDAAEGEHERCEEEPVHDPTDRLLGVTPLAASASPGRRLAKPIVWSSLRLAGSDVGAGSRDNSTVDAEGARALARRIAAQEQAAEAAANPAADGQTLKERLSTGPVSPAGVGQRRAQTTPSPGVELRIYAREVEKQIVDGRPTYVEIWWCRARERGVWQTPRVVREVVREAGSAPDASSARLNSLRPDSGGFVRLLSRLVALEP
jgi:hypothetical protein